MLLSTGTLALVGLVYLFFIQPKFERYRDNLIFDNRVLGFIDGLYLSGIRFGVPDFHMRSYVKDQLRKAHELPGNQFLIEYTCANGWHFSSHTGTGDHMLFALLCIAQFAKGNEDDELVAWCEEHMILAHKNRIHY